MSNEAGAPKELQNNISHQQSDSVQQLSECSQESGDYPPPHISFSSINAAVPSASPSYPINAKINYSNYSSDWQQQKQQEQAHSGDDQSYNDSDQESQSQEQYTVQKTDKEKVKNKIQALMPDVDVSSEEEDNQAKIASGNAQKLWGGNIFLNANKLYKENATNNFSSKSMNAAGNQIQSNLFNNPIQYNDNQAKNNGIFNFTPLKSNIFGFGGQYAKPATEVHKPSPANEIQQLKPAYEGYSFSGLFGNKSTPQVPSKESTNQNPLFSDLFGTAMMTTPQPSMFFNKHPPQQKNNQKSLFPDSPQNNISNNFSSNHNLFQQTSTSGIFGNNQISSFTFNNNVSVQPQQNLFSSTVQNNIQISNAFPNRNNLSKSFGMVLVKCIVLKQSDLVMCTNEIRLETYKNMPEFSHLSQPFEQYNYPLVNGIPPCFLKIHQNPQFSKESIFNPSSNNSKEASHLLKNKQQNIFGVQLKNQNIQTFQQFLVQQNEKKVIQSYIPKCSQFHISPTIQTLSKMSMEQLKEVKKCLIYNKFGIINFLEPINLSSVDIDEEVEIRKNSIFILHQDWKLKKCILIFSNFAKYSEFDEANQKVLLPKIQKWVKKQNYQFVEIDEFTGDLKVMANV